MKLQEEFTIYLSVLAILIFGAFLVYMIYEIGLLGSIARAADFKIDIVREGQKPVVKELPMREWVLNEAKKAKIDVKRIDKLVQCESRWNTNAVSRTGKYVGLFQISSIHGLTVEQRKDYKVSTAWALKQIKANGYRAWPYCGFIN